MTGAILWLDAEKTSVDGMRCYPDTSRKGSIGFVEGRACDTSGDICQRLTEWQLEAAVYEKLVTGRRFRADHFAPLHLQFGIQAYPLSRSILLVNNAKIQDLLLYTAVQRKKSRYVSIYIDMYR